ncbi:MAG: ABC transporter ATP-binding protein [Prevotella sp.]|nr:ABC transporter ATP-binding protein [Prevotella sp.]
MKLQISNIRKCFGEKTAVDIQDFTVNHGDILGLVGNNGAGKTTLFRIILDLLKADEGRVVMSPTDGEDGINPAESEEWKKLSGAYIDDGFLIDFLTPEEYFEFIARICSIDKETLSLRLQGFDTFMAGEIMEQKKLIRDFSAGNKQKIGIIAALLNQPQLLILDEPFNFLDPSSQNILKRILTQFHQETNATILISSHNLQHTTDISTRIALLESGKIIKDLSNEEHRASEELEIYFSVNE